MPLTGQGEVSKFPLGSQVVRRTQAIGELRTNARKDDKSLGFAVLDTSASRNLVGIPRLRESTGAMR